MTKVALVTGGVRGIGRAVSLALKEAGYVVAATYVGSDENAAAFSKETGIKTYKWNVGDFDACAKGVASVEADLGPIDVLVNNAGITRDTMFHKMTSEQWREVMSTNLDSIFNMIQPVLASMRERNFGRIINITSVNAQKGQMGQTNYCAAKGGMIGFTRALALEVAKKGITANCIAPGYVDTDMMSAIPPKVLEGIISGIPAGRLGNAEEIAHCVLFLADDKAGFVNGATISANGAQHMS